MKARIRTDKEKLEEIEKWVKYNLKLDKQSKQEGGAYPVSIDARIHVWNEILNIIHDKPCGFDKW